MAQNNHEMEINQQFINNILSNAETSILNNVKYPLTDLNKFEGNGIYAIFLTAPQGSEYEGYVSADRPIYIGKAVVDGSRQGNVSNNSDKDFKIYSRLREHRRSIELGAGINTSMFKYTYITLSGIATNLNAAIESHLIRTFKPLWNSKIDGFGNHAPGSGRYEQSPSEWDTLHPGRAFAAKLTGAKPDISIIIDKIKRG